MIHVPEIGIRFVALVYGPCVICIYVCLFYMYALACINVALLTLGRLLGVTLASAFSRSWFFFGENMPGLCFLADATLIGGD